ncbi:MAG: hypothetical protein ACRCTJ_05740, partial [Brevinema sp.]
EFLTSKDAQEKITSENFEFPINPEVKATSLFTRWNDKPKIENVTLDDWGKYYEEAYMLIAKNGWQ